MAGPHPQRYAEKIYEHGDTGSGKLCLYSLPICHGDKHLVDLTDILNIK